MKKYRLHLSKIGADLEELTEVQAAYIGALSLAHTSQTNTVTNFNNLIR